MTNRKTVPEGIPAEIELLADSISQIVRNFRQLNNPLSESQEKVPLAAQQLDKVTEQTEAATHRMLDIVESITDREEGIIAGLQVLSELAAGEQSDKIKTKADELAAQAKANLNDSYRIMDALQFQDITAQQINHATCLLEQIQTKLGDIGDVLTGREPQQQEPSEQPGADRRLAYDPNADLFIKRTEQAEVDDLISRNASKE